LLLFDWVGYSL